MIRTPDSGTVTVTARFRTFIRAILFICISCIALVLPRAEAALIANWKLDETSGQTAVDSASGYDGQLGTTGGADTEDPSIGLPGQIGTAYGFSSANSQRVELSPHISNFAVLTGGSITGWFRFGDQNRGALFNFGQIANTDRLLLETSNAGNLRFIVRSGATNLTDISSTGTFEDNTWRHFAVINDGASTSLYINGAAAFSTTFNSGAWFDNIEALANPDTFTLGYEVRNGGGSTFPLDGQLDDIAVFDHVLTPQELSNVINLGAENFAGSVAIPEPAATTLLGLGGLALVFRRRK